ncbi:protein phosphatase 2C domain-containing protein [Glaciimonas sp. Gout2]|uniref:PP2C family protein-serine/threonine phosphatase n=1 Tax=unclassified Glaciimonas TaxID=2644401 RepID=UPI002AB482A8|nr:MULTISPECIES: protein phosphatase 2C domain-containing protein [unclassified Glaciimonas]MDY7548394.1 protein phosphatase 2C domain-containing protein [Glaciimonas sp. CA11.2]MEB0010456.1 protein phosphatase 2C domain-containing protein [Glaciimonas sp. Cout2]MEB0084001.1 protein phosphatase 2C domain-containing protein [Glaciimonas sp. Gout2]
MSQYKVDAGTGQHIGDRTEQQDRVALLSAGKAPGYMMAILADGMGGRTGGDLAAEQLIITAKQLFNEFSPLTDTVEQLLLNIALETRAIIKLSAATSDTDPHSTMVALVLSPDGLATWGHVGDSRLYRFEGAKCIEHTIDHSYVEKMTSEGKISPAEAPSHPMSNVLINAIGSTTEIPFVSIGRHTGLKTGDAFLLCSDGFWPYFTETEMGLAIDRATVREAAEMFIARVRVRTVNIAADNCTLAIIKLVTPSKYRKNADLLV